MEKSPLRINAGDAVWIVRPVPAIAYIIRIIEFHPRLGYNPASGNY